MSKILLALVIFFNTLSVYALSADHFPSSFSIKQIKCPEGKHCMTITEQGENIGTLQSVPDQPNIFYFFDEQQQKQVTLKKLASHPGDLECTPEYCPTFRDFDIFDKNDQLIAKLELSNDVMQFSFDGFELYTKDRKHLLLKGMHTRLSGIRSVMYDGLDPSHKLALITRPFFTFSLDSDVTLWDKPGLLFRVDPNIFAATLALYCNTSLFYEKSKYAYLDQEIKPKVIRTLRAKLQVLAENQGLLVDLHADVSDQAVKAAGESLIQRYQQIYHDNFWDTNGVYTQEEKLQQLVQLGTDVIMAHGMSTAEDLATLQFLISLLYTKQ